MSDKHSDDPLVELPNRSPCTFLEMPFVSDLDNFDADIAILGVPYGMPYESHAMANDQSRAPDAIRQFTNTTDIHYTLNHFDWDLVEIAPVHDVGNITMVHAERLICNFIGACARAGYYDGH